MKSWTKASALAIVGMISTTSFVGPAILTANAAPSLTGASYSGIVMAREYAFTTGNVNMREGPSTRYRVIVTIPEGQEVYIHGCLKGRNWCDVEWQRFRGYVYDRYLSDYETQYAPPHFLPPAIIFEYEKYRDRDYVVPKKRHHKRYDRPTHNKRKFGKKRKKRDSLEDWRDRRREVKQRKKEYGNRTIRRFRRQ